MNGKRIKENLILVDRDVQLIISEVVGFEEVCRLIAGKKDIFYGTNGEVFFGI